MTEENDFWTEIYDATTTAATIAPLTALLAKHTRCDKKITDDVIAVAMPSMLGWYLSRRHHRRWE